MYNPIVVATIAPFYSYRVLTLTIRAIIFTTIDPLLRYLRFHSCRCVRLPYPRCIRILSFFSLSAALSCFSLAVCVSAFCAICAIAVSATRAFSRLAAYDFHLYHQRGFYHYNKAIMSLDESRSLLIFFVTTHWGMWRFHLYTLTHFPQSKTNLIYSCLHPVWEGFLYGRDGGSPAFWSLGSEEVGSLVEAWSE